MLLSARILDNVSGVNSFSYASKAALTEGDAPTIYFQLVDASQDRPDQGFVPSGRRFVPNAGATLSVVLDNIDSAKKVTRVATQPFPGDLSIWALTIMSTDKLRGTVNMKLTLTQGVAVTKGLLMAALAITNLDGMV